MSRHPLLSTQPKANEAMQKRSRRRGKWVFWAGMVLFVLGTIVISLEVLSHDNLEDIQSLQAQWDAARPKWLLWRLLLLAVFIGGYQWWVNIAASLLKLSPWQRERALKQRAQTTTLLVMTELLFGQRGLYVLCHWLFPGL